MSAAFATTNDQPLLTACLIVKNEEANLPRCLSSLRGLADSLSIVDTGSEDRTVAIAREFGAKIVEEPWRYDFAYHRNTALNNAAGRWALMIDADESIGDIDVQETRARLASDDLPDVLLAKMLLHYPGEMTASFFAPRLLRQAAGIRYIHAVHEQLDIADAPALLSNIVIEHHGYRERAALERKERRNLDIAEKMEPSAHRDHCIARAAFSLQNWAKTVTAARRIVDSDAPPVLKQEACALGGAAALSLQQGSALAEFVSGGLAVAPHSTDLLLLQSISALIRYSNALGHAERGVCGQLRPALLNHDREKVSRILRDLAGRPSVAHEEQKTRGDA